MEIPKIQNGKKFTDHRGSLYANDFVATKVKRIYFIQNANELLLRGWQGHKIERRWFCAASGKFKISAAMISHLENPGEEVAPVYEFLLESPADILHFPPGYASAIQMLEAGSCLLVMADYELKEIDDEYRFPFTTDKI